MKNNKPLVSIITPSYNQGKFLEETIQSVLQQDYPAIEYIIIDGGSTDNSQAIIHSHESEIAWWVSEKDNGQADAINKGLKRARGEVVAWLNSDDVYLAGAIGKAVGALTKNPECGMVFSNVLSIDAKTRIINLMRYGNWKLSDLMEFKIIGQPGVFINRRVLDKTGLLDETYNFLLDHHLWIRIAMNSQIKYTDDFWAAARYHSEAKNVSQGSGFGNEAFKIVEWMKKEQGLIVLFNKYQKKIYAGAYNFSARYLLDSGLPKKAFKEYLKSLSKYPPIALVDYRRILFSFFRFPKQIFQANDFPDN